MIPFGVLITIAKLSGIECVVVTKDISKYLFRDCVVDSGHKGIIIGFEDNNQFFDYYYIVYVPELDKVVYQLCNDARFINSIEI